MQMQIKAVVPNKWFFIHLADVIELAFAWSYFQGLILKYSLVASAHLNIKI